MQRPSDGRTNVRQQIGPRVRYYGKARMGGQVVFFESIDGVLHQVIAYNHGEVEEFEAFYLNDLEVTLDGSGFVTDDEYKVGTEKLVQIETRPGTATQTAFGDLVTAFPSAWSSAHRLKGIACAYARFTDTSAEEHHRVYTQGHPNVTPVVKAYNQIFDPRDDSTGWTDNAGLIIRDHLTNVDGIAMDAARLDEASFEAFADLCDEDVALGAGGTEKRYRIWLGYSLEEDPHKVQASLLAACDASLYQTAAGKVAIRGGKYTAPTVTLDADAGHIIDADLHRGADALARYNTLRFTYTDEGLDLLEQEGDPWIDSDLLTANGGVTETQSFDVIACPSHSQGRRLARIRSAKDNPEWIGRLRTNLFGMDAWEEEYVTVKIPELEIDGPFRVDRISALSDGTGCIIDVQSIDPTKAYGWATGDEGSPPVGSASLNPLTPPAAPTGVAVDAVQRGVNGAVYGTVVRVTWAAPARSALAHEVQYRITGLDGWQALPMVPAGSVTTDTPLIDADTDHDVRVRAVTPQGVPGDWSDIVTAGSGAVDSTVVGIPTGVSGVGGEDSYVITYTTPADANTAGVRLRDSTVNDFATATVRTSRNDPPSTLRSIPLAKSAGVYYVWVTAYNGSGVEGAEVYAGAMTVTTTPGGE